MKNTGMTLVELLIVVTVIGVLASVGIPTYRKMIQKARKSEAKIGLGAIYRAESAFYAEMGFYSNRLLFLGMDLDEGDTAPTYYNIGFPCYNECGCPWNWMSAPVIIPSVPAMKAAIEAKYPTYYDINTSGIVLNTLTTTASTYCLPSSIPPDGSFYTATATGAIAPGIDIQTATASETDQWTMNHRRELSNVRDGSQ